jgi:hypothetical protein
MNTFTRTLATLRDKAAPGDDGINNKLLKKCPPIIHQQLFYLFQSSLKIGHVPKIWKISKIIMIPKKDKPRDLISSYRPISLLNTIGKWCEKIVNEKLQNWAEINKILPETQAGFRKHRSTQDQILRLTNDVLHGFNNKLLVAAILFDLEKAFDKTPHKGIVQCLKNKGLNETLVKWVESFLNDRFFYVAHNKSKSSLQNITCGVPQGSCLSPTLFILYFSDVVKSIDPEVNVALFADDLCVWAKKKTILQSTKTLQKAVDQISKFCKKWGFLINKSKTNYITFTPAGKRNGYEAKYALNIHIDGEKIPLDAEPVFLGIALDPKLNFQNHLKKIQIKIIPKINIIKRIKSFKWNTSTSTALMLYKSYVRSLLDYCNLIIAIPSQRITKKLQIIQNNILRIIKYFPLKTTVNQMHEALKIQTLEQRYEFLFKKFTYIKTSNNILVEEVQNFLRTNPPEARATNRFKCPFELWSEIHKLENN